MVRTVRPVDLASSPMVNSAVPSSLMPTSLGLPVGGDSRSATRPWSAEDARVAEGVAARLRVDRETVRAAADLDAGQLLAGAGVDRVHLGVVAPRQPQHLAV